ncbi:MAG: hypothetical protein PHE27_03130 [Alphaproteobacteria bacterium]|nr:hypothetical protein [Alphaproteobacteria bacterium]
MIVPYPIYPGFLEQNVTHSKEKPAGKFTHYNGTQVIGTTLFTGNEFLHLDTNDERIGHSYIRDASGKIDHVDAAGRLIGWSTIDSRNMSIHYDLYGYNIARTHKGYTKRATDADFVADATALNSSLANSIQSDEGYLDGTSLIHVAGKGMVHVSELKENDVILMWNMENNTFAERKLASLESKDQVYGDPLLEITFAYNPDLRKTPNEEIKTPTLPPLRAAPNQEVWAMRNGHTGESYSGEWTKLKDLKPGDLVYDRIHNNFEIVSGNFSVAPKAPAGFEYKTTGAKLYRLNLKGKPAKNSEVFFANFLATKPGNPMVQHTEPEPAPESAPEEQTQINPALTPLANLQQENILSPEPVRAEQSLPPITIAADDETPRKKWGFLPDVGLGIVSAIALKVIMTGAEVSSIAGQSYLTAATAFGGLFAGSLAVLNQHKMCKAVGAELTLKEKVTTFGKAAMFGAAGAAFGAVSTDFLLSLVHPAATPAATTAVNTSNVIAIPAETANATSNLTSGTDATNYTDPHWRYNNYDADSSFAYNREWDQSQWSTRNSAILPDDLATERLYAAEKAGYETQGYLPEWKYNVLFHDGPI